VHETASTEYPGADDRRGPVRLITRLQRHQIVWWTLPAFAVREAKAVDVAPTKPVKAEQGERAPSSEDGDRADAEAARSPCSS
jgi:hypothetical protein